MGGHMRRVRLLAATCLLCASAADAQPSYVPGVFVGTSKGPVELITYAEPINSGQMRLSGGSFDDVPVVETVDGILCSLPNWKPVGVWMANSRIFRDERAERRLLPSAGRQLNVATIELRVRDLEDRARAERLIRNVKLEGDEVPYVFVHVGTGSGVERHYMVRLR